MTDKTQATAHAEITAPISADLRRIKGASPVIQAVRLLREAAAELKNGNTIGGDWGDEIEALDAYNEHMAVAATLEQAEAGQAVPAHTDAPINEPVTKQMIDAGAKAAREYMARTGGNNLTVIYRAMRAVAPAGGVSASPAQEHATQLAGQGQDAPTWGDIYHCMDDIRALLARQHKMHHSEFITELAGIVTATPRREDDYAAAPAQGQEDAREQPRLTVRLTSYPESNGKRNWTALLVRAEKWGGLIGNGGGITVARGELWNRVAYEAERARFLLGHRDTEPFILDYGDDIETPEEWKGENRDAARAAQGGAA